MKTFKQFNEAKRDLFAIEYENINSNHPVALVTVPNKKVGEDLGDKLVDAGLADYAGWNPLDKIMDVGFQGKVKDWEKKAIPFMKKYAVKNKLN